MVREHAGTAVSSIELEGAVVSVRVGVRSVRVVVSSTSLMPSIIGAAVVGVPRRSVSVSVSVKRYWSMLRRLRFGEDVAPRFSLGPGRCMF